MSPDVRIITVDSNNVEEEGFFCYKSKPKSEGYRNKLAWLQARLDEGMTIHILYEGGRSVGFVEVMPGEVAWRAVDAPDYLVIHCLWVVGKGKGKGYGTRLIDRCVADAEARGKQGVVMVASRGNWLARDTVFLKNGFHEVDTAPPTFNLLVRPLRDGSSPAFPQNWDARAAAYGTDGATVVYTDQCPYMPDAVAGAVTAFEERGVPVRTVKLDDAATVRATSPSPYGVFSIVLNGRLFCYHYLGRRELRQLDELLASR